MPELPEVEHNRRHLEKWMQSTRIVEVVTDDARIVRPSKPRAFVRAVTGHRVESVARRGKWLRLSLDGGELLFAHLGMTGWFEHGSTGDPPLRFDRVHFDVERRGKRTRVTYTDPRRWGRMVLAREEIEAWQALGPDPLDDGIDLEALAAKLARRKKLSIKEALMDQRVLAGVGNIHAIEALWKARIDPRSTASAVSLVELRAIARGLAWSIERALADLARPDGGEKNPFKIYGHRGEPCPRCGTELTRILLGGRTTMLCPGCQRRHG